MNRMPAGQYIPGASVIHRLDARVKILSLLFLLGAVIMSSSVLSYGFILCVIAVIAVLSGLSGKMILEPIFRLWLFFIIIFAMNSLFFDSADPIWSWLIFRLSTAGIRQGAKVVLNVILIMILSGILTRTTAPMDTTAAISALIKPLRLIRIPTEDIAMIISAAIQFIPTLIEETDMIRKAQTARGARFESKKLTERAVSFLPLVVPIFLASFRRADDLAMAMEARGYRNARSRTKKARIPLRRRDYLALSGSLGVCLTQLLVIVI